MFDFLKKKRKERSIEEILEVFTPRESKKDENAELLLARKALSVIPKGIPTEEYLDKDQKVSFYSEMNVLSKKVGYQVLMKTLMEEQTKELLTKAETTQQLSFARGVLYGITLLKEEVDELAVFYQNVYINPTGSGGDD